jgi:hypothetical protein
VVGEAVSKLVLAGMPCSSRDQVALPVGGTRSWRDPDAPAMRLDQ